MTSLVTNNSLSDQKLLAMGQKWRSVAHTRAIGRKFSYGELVTLIWDSHLANKEYRSLPPNPKHKIYHEIEQVALNPQKFKGKSYSISEKTISDLGLKNLWIEMSPYGKRIDLLFVPFTPPPEGVNPQKGCYQVADNALFIEIPLILNKEGKRLYKHTPYVLKTIRTVHARLTEKRSEEQLEEVKNIVLRCMRKHEQLQKKFGGNKEVKIPPCPRQKNPSAEDGSQALEWVQPWYACLEDVIWTRSIPLNFHDKNNKSPVSLKQILLMAVSILQTLKTIFYEEGCVHSDVKAKNALVNEKLEVLLIDFDTSEVMGKHTGPPDYTRYTNFPYWDLLAKNNIKTPLLDINGLLISLMELLSERTLDAKCLTYTSLCTSQSPYCLNNEKLSENILKSLLEKAEKLRTIEDKKIVSSIFHLMCEVHRDSLKTYNFLKENPSLTSKIQGNDEQGKKEALTEIDKCLLTEEEITLYSTEKEAAAELKNANFPFIYLQKIQSKLKAIVSN